MASRWVKWLLRIFVVSAGLVVLCIVVLIGWLLFDSGLRWPTVHHVDQGEWADTLYIKADDFLDDSGYVVTAAFQNCCSDRFLCEWPSSRESISYLNKSNRVIAVPLHWPKRSMCSYRLYDIYVESSASHKYFSFSGDSARAPFPKILDLAWLRPDHEDSALHSLNDSKGHLQFYGASFSLPHAQDTLFIRKLKP
jgi:hypothetical protein